MLLSLDFEGKRTVENGFTVNLPFSYFQILTENLLIGRNANKLFNIVLQFPKIWELMKTLSEILYSTKEKDKCKIRTCRL